MYFRYFIVLSFISLNLNCSLSDKSPQNTDKLGRVKTGIVQTPSKTKVTNIFFDKEAFKKEVHQKLTQIGMPEEEQIKQFDLIKSRTLKFKRAIEQQLEDLFSNSSLKPEQIINGSVQIIDSIEPGIRQIIDASYLSRHLALDTLNKLAYLSALDNQRLIQNTVKNLMDSYVERRLDTFLNQIGTVREQITKYSDHVIQRTQSITGPHTPQAFFEKEIMGPVKESLRNNYGRAELGLLKDSELIKGPDGEAYQFQSIKQPLSFPDLQIDSQSHKFIRVYNGLWYSHPFHEQGVLARKCGLAALEVADQTMMTPLIQKADILYISASALEEIVIFGVLPSDTRRGIYELCTGRNLITGAVLTDEDISALPIDESYFNEHSVSGLFNISEITDALREISMKVTADESFAGDESDNTQVKGVSNGRGDLL